MSRTLRVINGGAAARTPVLDRTERSPGRHAEGAVGPEPRTKGRSEDNDRPLTLDAAFRAHAGFVASVALRVLGRPTEVDDLVQDVFVCILPRLGELRDPAAVRAWLAVITARLARRRLRSRRWKIWLGVGGDHDYTQLADAAASAEDRALLGELYRALDHLPVHHRLAWVLRHAEGLDLAAVAEACDCSLATVKRWIGAAESALRKEVDHE